MIQRRPVGGGRAPRYFGARHCIPGDVADLSLRDTAKSSESPWILANSEADVRNQGAIQRRPFCSSHRIELRRPTRGGAPPGPDKGSGGTFLFLPPDYKGAVTMGDFVSRPKAFGHWLAGRGFTVNGSPTPAVESIKKHLRICDIERVQYRCADESSRSKYLAINHSQTPSVTGTRRRVSMLREVADSARNERASIQARVCRAVASGARA